MVMKRPMVAFLTQLLFAIRSRFTRRARLEAENLLLRQQLVVLRRKSPKRMRLWNIDRLLLVWLYRLLSLLKISSEPEFERLRGISIESIRSGEGGCNPNVKPIGPGSEIEEPPIHGSSDGGVAAAAQPLVSRKQGRIRRRDVRSGDAGH